MILIESEHDSGAQLEPLYFVFVHCFISFHVFGMIEFVNCVLLQIHMSNLNWNIMSICPYTYYMKVLPAQRFPVACLVGDHLIKAR